MEGKSKGTDQPGRENQGSASTVCHPSRLFLALVLFLQVVMVGQSKRTNEKEREGTRAKDSADLFARSSPLFCSLCCLHRRTIASRSPPRHRRTSNQGEMKG